jgi:hypothetical protein
MERLGLFYGSGFRDACHGTAGRDRRRQGLRRRQRERTAYRAAAALLEANGIALDLGGNRERAEERLFEYFRGRLSQAGVAEWFKTWMGSSGR